jgi:hypothetical protein
MTNAQAVTQAVAVRAVVARAEAPALTARQTRAAAVAQVTARHPSMSAETAAQAS